MYAKKCKYISMPKMSEEKFFMSNRKHFCIPTIFIEELHVKQTATNEMKTNRSTTFTKTTWQLTLKECENVLSCQPTYQSELGIIRNVAVHCMEYHNLFQAILAALLNTAFKEHIRWGWMHQAAKVSLLYFIWILFSLHKQAQFVS